MIIIFVEQLFILELLIKVTISLIFKTEKVNSHHRADGLNSMTNLLKNLTHQKYQMRPLEEKMKVSLTILTLIRCREAA